MRFLMFLLPVTLFAQAPPQVIPPPPVISTVTPAVGQVTITADIGGCEGTTCGLSSCSCWYQLYRAPCTGSSCPPPREGDPYVFPPNATLTRTGNQSGSQHLVWVDPDPALAEGTSWNYFLSANYSAYTPYTPSAPTACQTNAVFLPANNNVGFPFSVYLDFTNPQCVNGNTCFLTAYRATCPKDTSGVTQCPGYFPGSTFFAKLPAADANGKSYTTATVTPSGTTFEYKDDGGIPGNLGYGVTYTYAVTNSYDAFPSQSSAASATSLITPIQHQATLNYSNPACNSTTAACSLQVYRARCSTATSCPAYIPGNAAWKTLNMAGVTANVTAQGTSWRYQDLDTALANSTTYAWVATNAYAGGSAGQASQAYVGTTAATRRRDTHAKDHDHSAGGVTGTVRPN
jgi:hypothetical protein